MRKASRCASETCSEAGGALARPAFHAVLGLGGETESLSHRELQERRKIVQKKLEDEGGFPGF